MGLALREHVPLIISKNYQPAASLNVIEAQYEDIVATMTQVVESSKLGANPIPASAESAAQAVVQEL